MNLNFGDKDPKIKQRALGLPRWGLFRQYDARGEQFWIYWILHSDLELQHKCKCEIAFIIIIVLFKINHKLMKLNYYSYWM